ncbi:unnamed protein product [Brachionus calyciflorus]|uniref:E3 ubiquitin-protein ligase CHIP n=1 Tax=Brachionus calyciflorus TaxID=104777 RepID=A0A814CLV2_9BILA|nr:unnamed protein product [Brachionus calyciflorus]
MTSSTSMQNLSNKYKEDGNKLFMKRNYKEAIEMYTKAIDKCPNVSTYYTNRALCFLKLCQWTPTIEDCRRAIDLDSHSVKAFFYMGQAMCESNLFDEAIVNLKKAYDLAKELNENYGDEITRTIRNAKKKRWNFLEEKRISQEIELQNYLNRLMLEDKERELSRVKTSDECCNDKEKELSNQIELQYQKRMDELNKLFNENDSRRRRREIPDYLCGKISFELMHDPVITPSGITYDRSDIEQHLQRVGRFDPVTRQELNTDQLIPNLAMKEVIENFVRENEWIDGAL